MIVVQSLALFVFAAVVFAVAAMVLMESRVAVRRRVVVNLSDGSAVDGVLLRRHRTLLVMGDATLLLPSAEPSRVDGDLVIERSRVLYLQAVR